MRTWEQAPLKGRCHVSTRPADSHPLPPSWKPCEPRGLPGSWASTHIEGAGSLELGIVAVVGFMLTVIAVCQALLLTYSHGNLRSSERRKLRWKEILQLAG